MSDDDKVRPGNPPKQYRWKPGQSGNPRGRPSERKTMTAKEFIEHLDEPVAAQRKGEQTKVHPYEAGLTQLVRKTVNNRDITAARKFLMDCKKYRVIEPRKERTYGGVVYVPLDVDRHEFIRRVDAEGPPPWDDDE